MNNNTDNKTPKETICLNIIDTEHIKIRHNENHIMSERLHLIHELENADDVYKVYRSIKNAMTCIEEQMHMIDCCKDSIIGAYKLMNDADC